MEQLVDLKEKYISAASTVPIWQWAVILVVVVKAWNYYQSYIPVPVYGGILSFSRLLSTFRLSRHGPEVFTQIYAKYPMINIPRLDSWVVFVQPQFIEELFRAPDDTLSFLEATFDGLQAKYTMGERILTTQDHHHAIQHDMTRHLGVLFPEVLEEVQLAFNELKFQEGTVEWQKVHVFPFVLQIVARASNRIFVGAPFCRNKEWIDMNLNSPAAVMATATILNLFPNWSHPILGPMISSVKSRNRKARKMIGPLIEERLRLDPSEYPDDFITWLLAAAPESDRTVDGVVARLLIVNFAAIHTSSINFAHALYWLLAKPKHFIPLREEIEETVGRLGWTKDAIGQMPKLESFMRECMRMSPLAAQAVTRKALKPYTFSNGVTVPAGTYVAGHLHGTHRDGSIYEQPDEFDGERFVDETKSNEERKKPRQTMYTTSKAYLPFGHGRHACPGRFFAAMELKMLMAYMVVNYDMKWPEEDVPIGATEKGYRPADLWFNFTFIPNQSAHMMIRKRA